MKFRWIWRIALLFLVAVSLNAWAGKMPAAGDRLIPLRLTTPSAPAERAYLGLAASDTFDPVDLTGRLLVIEIFSMYCPHCQREAPAVNRLYQAIEASADLRGKVKMIGIGVGNSEFEIGHFRKHYQIPFPLFPDAEFSIHQSLGEVRTPFFIIAALGSADRGRILWTGVGNLEPVDTVIGRLNGFLNQR